MMKKILIVLLVMMLLLSTAACGGDIVKDKPKNPSSPDEGSPATQAADTPVDGGWSDAQSIAVSSEVKAMFDKINETMTGAYYEPIVYLESQVVAGTNHLVLCKEILSTANEDALGTYTIVTVYEDLEGNAEITQVQQSAVTAPQPYNPENPVAGGWGEPETYAPTDEAKAALTKAGSTASGVSYQPIALLGTQIVAGTNYRLLCKVTEGADLSYYMIITVYADLQGGAEIIGQDGFAVEDGISSAGNEESASSQAE